MLRESSQTLYFPLDTHSTELQSHFTTTITHPVTEESVAVNVTYARRDLGVMMRADERVRTVVTELVESRGSEPIRLDELSEMARTRLHAEAQSHYLAECEKAAEIFTHP